MHKIVLFHAFGIYTEKIKQSHQTTHTNMKNLFFQMRNVSRLLVSLSSSAAET